MTHVRRIVCLLALAAMPVGCIAKVDYTPNSEILKEIGYEQGQRMLTEILTRARRPRIVNAVVSPELFTYTVSRLAPGWLYLGIVDNRMQVYFNNVRNVDIYENDRVFVYDLSGRKISQFDFLARQDSLHFADLLLAFRDAGSTWPAPHNEGPAPRDETHEPRDDAAPPRANDGEDEETADLLLRKDTPPASDDEPYSGDDEEKTRDLLDDD